MHRQENSSVCLVAANLSPQELFAGCRFFIAQSPLYNPGRNSRPYARLAPHHAFFEPVFKALQSTHPVLCLRP